MKLHRMVTNSWAMEAAIVAVIALAVVSLVVRTGAWIEPNDSAVALVLMAAIVAATLAWRDKRIWLAGTIGLLGLCAALSVSPLKLWNLSPDFYLNFVQGAVLLMFAAVAATRFFGWITAASIFALVWFAQLVLSEFELAAAANFFVAAISAVPRQVAVPGGIRVDFTMLSVCIAATVSVYGPARRTNRLLLKGLQLLVDRGKTVLAPWWAGNLLVAFALIGATGHNTANFGVAGATVWIGLGEIAGRSAGAMAALFAWSLTGRAAGESGTFKRLWMALTPLAVLFAIYVVVSGVLHGLLVTIFCVWGLTWRRDAGPVPQRRIVWPNRMLHIACWVAAVNFLAVLMAIPMMAGNLLASLDPITLLGPMAVWFFAVFLGGLGLGFLLVLRSRAARPAIVDVVAVAMVCLLIGLLIGTPTKLESAIYEIERLSAFGFRPLGVLAVLILSSALAMRSAFGIDRRRTSGANFIQAGIGRAKQATFRIGVLAAMKAVSLIFVTYGYLYMSSAWARLFRP